MTDWDAVNASAKAAALDELADGEWHYWGGVRRVMMAAGVGWNSADGLRPQMVRDGLIENRSRSRTRKVRLVTGAPA